MLKIISTVQKGGGGGGGGTNPLVFPSTFESVGVGARAPLLLRQWLVLITSEPASKIDRESTEGYSKSIVRKSNDKFGERIGLNK